MRSLTEFIARPFRAGVLVVAIAAGIVGLAAGYESAFASPVSPHPIAAPADGAGGAIGSGDEADQLCWRCPPRIYPIIVYPYPCATPVGGPAVAPPPVPTPGGMASTLTYRVCPQTAGKIPPAVEVHALAAPWEIYGYGMLRNPNVPYHPMWNSYRTWLSIRNPNVPYSRCNPVVWNAGCP